MDLTLRRYIDQAPNVIVEQSMPYIMPVYKSEIIIESTDVHRPMSPGGEREYLFLTTVLANISRNRNRSLLDLRSVLLIGHSPWPASSFHISLLPLVLLICAMAATLPTIPP